VRGSVSSLLSESFAVRVRPLAAAAATHVVVVTTASCVHSRSHIIRDENLLKYDPAGYAFACVVTITFAIERLERH